MALAIPKVKSCHGMAKDSIEIEFVKGHAVSQRRGIAWLRIDGNDNINAEKTFKELSENEKLFLLASMGAWLDGKPDISTRFHGFPNEPANKDCYVFKWRDERVQQRIYGFKTRPGIPDNRFEVCILAMHTIKTSHETDPWYKDAMNQLRTDVDIQAAILRQVNELFSTKISSNQQSSKRKP